MDEITIIHPKEFPELLREINDPPKKLYLRGKLSTSKYKYLAVVGSRKYSPYGREVCQKLISGLSGYPIVIVSGLALGIDAIAHRSALEASLLTVAIPGSGIADKALHPRANFNLSQDILRSGGAILSEYEPKFKATIWSFPKRNRLMAGLSHATLIIEASEKSGTLITARLAMEYNREVLVVPGPILSKAHQGSNQLIKDGAYPALSSEDILESLGFDIEDKKEMIKNENLSEDEKKVRDLLEMEPLSKDELIHKIDLPVTQANILLSAMELKGLIRERLGKFQI